jgi:hypothetical protein
VEKRELVTRDLNVVHTEFVGNLAVRPRQPVGVVIIVAIKNVAIAGCGQVLQILDFPVLNLEVESHVGVELSSVLEEVVVGNLILACVRDNVHAFLGIDGKLKVAFHSVIRSYCSLHDVVIKIAEHVGIVRLKEAQTRDSDSVETVSAGCVAPNGGSRVVGSSNLGIKDKRSVVDFLVRNEVVIPVGGVVVSKFLSVVMLLAEVNLHNGSGAKGAGREIHAKRLHFVVGLRDNQFVDIGLNTVHKHGNVKLACGVRSTQIGVAVFVHAVLANNVVRETVPIDGEVRVVVSNAGGTPQIVGELVLVALSLAVFLNVHVQNLGAVANSESRRGIGNIANVAHHVDVRVCMLQRLLVPLSTSGESCGTTVEGLARRIANKSNLRGGRVVHKQTSHFDGANGANGTSNSGIGR